MPIRQNRKLRVCQLRALNRDHLQPIYRLPILRRLFLRTRQRVKNIPLVW